jgi:hypothetical protein
MIFRLAAKDRRRGAPKRPEDRRRRRLRPTLLALEERRLLSTIVVNNATDSPEALEIDLRQAIDMANTNGGDETITFDSTVFGTAQTIELTSGPLELSDTTGTETITGPSGGLTIGGGGLSRVFQVDNGVTASVSGMTITGGQTAGQGGGLYNDGGTVTLTDCTISGNSSTFSSAPGGGGGVATANGTTTLTGCTISGNSAARDGGGLVLNGGTMTLTDCTVAGNSSEIDGGGLSDLAGTMTLTSCTVIGNFTWGSLGGGVENSGGTATVTDTIVADNTAGSIDGWSTGIDYPNDIGGTVAGTYNLIGTGGSGGLINGVDGNLVGVADPGLGALGDYGGPNPTIPLLPGSPAINAGTVAGAPATDQRGELRVGAVDIGAFESQGFTITVVPGSTPQSAAIGAAFAAPLAVAVTANNPVEPVDGAVVSFVANPAADGASAILLAPSAVIAGGQAGVVGGPNDVDGSYTVTATVPGLAPASFDLTNNGPAFTRLAVTSTTGAFFAGAGALSLREAVALANADTSGNANISFDPKVFKAPQTITLAGTQLELSNTSEAETITGPKAGVTISGGGLSRVFQVDNAVQASISGCTLVGGVATDGGAVDNLGTLDLSDCLLEQNETTLGVFGRGAAITNEAGATLNLTDSTLTGNSITSGGGSGGAIANLGTATLTDCSLSLNSAPSGGAIWNYGGILALNGCQLDSNTAPPINFSSSGFGEYGPGAGGAVYSLNGTLNLTDCTLTGNSANVGGAISNDASDGASQLTLTDCTLRGNVADEYVSPIFGSQQPSGGAIFNQAYSNGEADLSLIGCRLTGNTAGTSGGYGGALSSYCFSYGGEATVSLNDCILSGNATGGIGGAVNTESGTLIMDGCTLTGNSAGQAGGGAAISGTDTMTNCTISGNTAQDGGGIDIYGTSQLSMSGCTVSGNTATGNGGGLYVRGLVTTYGYFGTYTSGPASLALSAVTVSGNAAAEGGGIFNAGTVTATGVTIQRNAAANGGGIDNVAGATATISGSSIVANDASGNGGGIANAGTLSLTATRIRLNTAAGGGGGLYNSGMAALTDCVVSGNSAANGGGIYTAPGGTVTLIGTLVTNNTKDNIVGTVTYE